MRKRKIILTSVLLASLWLSACAGLLDQAEKAVGGGNYGPVYSAQEHQTRTFEALWSDIKDTYIYYDSANVNWTSLHDTYAGRIKAGLTDKEFSTMLHELVTKLPTDAIAYQSRSERIDADTQDFSTYQGIGAIIGFQAKDVPHIVVLDVIKDSPAEQAGLKAHDSIYKIDGGPVLLEEGMTVVNRVRGPAGSTVTLDVKTPGKSERSIQVTRGKLTSSGMLTAYQIKGTQYGYILFPPVSYTNMYDDVVKNLQVFTTNQKMDGLILDLRVAGSSGTWPLQDMLTLFYNGQVGEFYNSAKQTQPITIKGQDQYSSQSVPLIILIGKNTSGSPEILAASLQAGKRAILIGETTPGSIESTSAFYLPDGSRAFIEAVSFRLTNGTEIGNIGVVPDVPEAAGWDAVLPNADPVLDAAIAALNGKK